MLVFGTEKYGMMESWYIYFTLIPTRFLNICVWKHSEFNYSGFVVACLLSDASYRNTQNVSILLLTVCTFLPIFFFKCHFLSSVLRYRYILNCIYFRAGSTLFRLAIYNKIDLHFIKAFNNRKISRKNK